MSQEIVNIGSEPSDGSGDPLRVSFNKINLNFTELYNSVSSLGGNVTPATGIEGSVTSVNGKTGHVSLTISDLPGGVTQGYVTNQIASEINGFLNTTPALAQTLLSTVALFQGTSSSTLLDAKANVTDVYTKTEIDNLVLNISTTPGPAGNGFSSVPPTTAIGAVGDSSGMAAIDTQYVYMCTGSYDGVTNIWTRTALNSAW